MGDDGATIRRWDVPVGVFVSAAAVHFSLVLAFMFVYRFNYRHIGHVLTLAALPVGLYWIEFHVS
jgi:hypothetical protein